jgi:hypothetical protein
LKGQIDRANTYVANNPTTQADLQIVLSSSITSAQQTYNNPSSTTRQVVTVSVALSAAMNNFIQFIEKSKPQLSVPVTGNVYRGTAISASSNKNGIVYLVTYGTSSDTVSIQTYAVDQKQAQAGMTVTFDTYNTKLMNGQQYVIYNIDTYGNVSNPSNGIVIKDYVPFGTLFPPYIMESTISYIYMNFNVTLSPLVTNQTQASSIIQSITIKHVDGSSTSVSVNNSTLRWYEYRSGCGIIIPPTNASMSDLLIVQFKQGAIKDIWNNSDPVSTYQVKPIIYQVKPTIIGIGY